MDINFPKQAAVIRQRGNRFNKVLDKPFSKSFVLAVRQEFNALDWNFGFRNFNQST
jgi:hypothetical protein